MNKTVWILGAGASIGHSGGNMPGINNFLAKGVELGIIDKKDVNSNLEKYIKDNFNKKLLSKNEDIDIEKLMTYIDIDIERNKNYSDANSMKKYLIELIIKILNKESEDIDKISEYNHFVEKLKKEDTIITFNWDIILDNILERDNIIKKNSGEASNEKVQNQYSNFITSLASYRKKTWDGIGGRPPYNKYNSTKGLYLKMHGSIDWKYCNNKSCDNHLGVYPVLENKKEYFCSECDEKVETMIIPPVLYKQYKKFPMIDRVWKKAEIELKRAKKLVIWGYSFPPTDFYSNWLVRETKEKIEELIIINPETIKKSETRVTWNQKGFLDKLKNIFRWVDRNVMIYEYFGDFLEGKEIEQKYSDLNKENIF